MFTWLLHGSPSTVDIDDNHGQGNICLCLAILAGLLQVESSAKTYGRKFGTRCFWA
jgi:hypothetical protein